MAERRFVTYEQLDEGSIVRIMLNRPEARNAQNRGMLVELNEAFLEAEADDRVRVVILGGGGKMVSAGDGMGAEGAAAERAPGPGQHPTVSGHGGAGARARRRNGGRGA